MSDIENLCPKRECRTALILHSIGDFDTWVCPKGHGVGFTLTEAYGHLREDEIHAIWEGAKRGDPSSFKSPALGHPMVSVTMSVDEEDSSPTTQQVHVNVATEEQFFWFNDSDFQSTPRPSREEHAEKVAEIAENFVNTWASATRKRQLRFPGSSLEEST